VSIYYCDVFIPLNSHLITNIRFLCCAQNNKNEITHTEKRLGVSVKVYSLTLGATTLRHL
jgi:hypothetical protein